MSKTIKFLAVLLAGVSLLGCAGMKERKRLRLSAVDNIQTAESEINAARASGANRYMQSGKSFKSAEMALSAAMISLEEKEYAEADRLALTAGRLARQSVAEAEQAEAARQKELQKKAPAAKPAVKKKR